MQLVIVPMPLRGEYSIPAALLLASATRIPTRIAPTLHESLEQNTKVSAPDRLRHGSSHGSRDAVGETSDRRRRERFIAPKELELVQEPRPASVDSCAVSCDRAE